MITEQIATAFKIYNSSLNFCSILFSILIPSVLQHYNIHKKYIINFFTACDAALYEKAV